MTTTPPDPPDDRFRLPPLEGVDGGTDAADDVSDDDVSDDDVSGDEADDEPVAPVTLPAWVTKEPEIDAIEEAEPAAIEPLPWTSLSAAADAIESVGSTPSTSADAGEGGNDDSVIAAAAAVIHAAEADGFDDKSAPEPVVLREPAPWSPSEPAPTPSRTLPEEPVAEDEWLPDFLRADARPTTAVATLEPEVEVRVEPLEAKRMAVARPSSRPTVARTLAEIPILLIVAAVIAFLVKTFLAQAYYIPSGSMLPQLQIDDRVVVSKLAYKAHDPRRGDIVVFDDPRPGVDSTQTVERTGFSKWIRKVGEGVGVVQPSTDEFIKRVIGLPGEHVEGHDGHVFINSRLLVEPYLPQGVTTSDFPEQTVEKGKLWVMGDNRSGSADSRVFGQIKINTIVGRAVVKVWPFSNTSFL